VEQLANLAAALARALPGNPEQAEGLSDAALKLWRAARDTINEQKAQAASYWQEMDKSQQMHGQVYDQARARLQKLSAAEFFDRELVSWQETEQLLFPDGNDEERAGQLHDMVCEAFGGDTWWAKWQPEDFRRVGFDHYAFITLIRYLDLKEVEREEREIAARNGELGNNLTRARQAKREERIRQQQEREMWKSPPIEDPT
jgi:hypothetical protein